MDVLRSRVEGMARPMKVGQTRGQWPFRPPAKSALKVGLRLKLDKTTLHDMGGLAACKEIVLAHSKAEHKRKNQFAAGLKFLEVYMSGLDHNPHL